MSNNLKFKAERSYSSPLFIYSGLIFFLLLASYLSLKFGGAGSIDDSSTGSLILWEIRYPRLIASILVGSALSLSGYVFQNVLKNPLADPYILGISSGAALGMALYVTFSSYVFTFGAQASAFLGAIFTLLILLLMFRFLLNNTIVVVLTGIGISFFFASIITLLLSYMEGNKLVYMNSWLIGNISQPDMRDLYILGLVLLVSSVLVYVFSNALDILQFGDDFAVSSGLSVKTFTVLFLVLASVLAASSVAVCGTLGFVGLVIPHMSRLIFKGRSSGMIPIVMLFGAGFLTMCNAIAGVLSFNIDVPVGAITSFIGAPALIYLIFRRYRSIC
ncbi:MAG: iron ABC transporter permease [bacterium]